MKDYKKMWSDKEIDTTPQYGIEGSVLTEVWTLYSVVETNFGGPAKNFIFEGSFDDCQQKMEQMKALDELARIGQEIDNALGEDRDKNPLIKE